jgi:hypothetical protein
MKQEIRHTFLWMVIFAAVTFFICPIIFVVIVFSHIMSDASAEHVMWVWRLIFIASPLVALFLGLRGALPGTKPLALTEHSAISKVLARIVIVIAALFTLGAWVAFHPFPGRPKVSIIFLGYTNGATGARLARFAITNLNNSTIFAYEPNIEIQSPTEPGGIANYFPGYNQWQQLHARIDEGASTNFTIIPPTNQFPWRLRLLVYPDVGVTHGIIKGAVSISCMSIGLLPRYWRVLPCDGASMMPYDIEGDWIKNEK